MIPDPTLDQWLTTSYRSLINALDEVLDLDIGLADATLTTHYDTLTADLDHVLDLAAGLQDIQPSPQPTSTTTDRAADAGSLTDYAHHVAALPAHDRLATRTWFPQHELTALQAISAAKDDIRALRPVLARVLDVHRDLADDLVRVLGHVRVFARALNLARNLARDLARDLGRALNLDRDLALDLDRDLGRVHDLSRAHSLALALNRALNLALDSAFDLVRVRDLDSARDLNRARDLVRDLDSARDFAVDLDLDRDFVRARDDIVDRTCYRLHAINNDLAASLADILKRADTLTSQDLNTALTQFEQALTDVTGADLTHANLNGIPLDGVLWSSDTRWPSHLQEQISRNSRLIGPDLYRINPPGGIGEDTLVDQNL